MSTPAVPVRRDSLSVVLGGAVLGAVALLSVARSLRIGAVRVPSVVDAWLAVLVGLCVQAVPFLVLGVAISSAITAFLPADLVARLLPRRQVLAVPVAGLAGIALPGCECASVPVANSLLRRGLPPAAALTFLLAAPAVNPVVLVATAVAFPTRPEMVWARLAASLLAAMAVGWLWVAFGRSAWLAAGGGHDHGGPGSRLERWRVAFLGDFVRAAGFLVLGAAMAATVNVAVPADRLARLGANPVVAVAVLALLAVLVAVCSEADAFVAASFVQFSPTAQLAFMVVSPMIDLKLISMQYGTFGRSFTTRFAPLTFVVAVAAACLVGSLLW